MASAAQLNRLPRTNKPMFWTFGGRGGDSDSYVCNMAYAEQPLPMSAPRVQALVLEWDTVREVAWPADKK